MSIIITHERAKMLWVHSKRIPEFKDLLATGEYICLENTPNLDNIDKSRLYWCETKSDAILLASYYDTRIIAKYTYILFDTSCKQYIVYVEFHEKF